MTPERWDRISALYVAALEQAPDARAGFLAAACADDVDLRQEVESLLRQELDSTPAIAAMALGSATNARGSASGARLGPYRLGPLIGAGGMGEVYRARDETLARDVAIKILPPAFAAEAGRRARFEREARVLASLNHPHIAAIYGVVEGEGHRGLVLELVDGETLAERVQRGARAGLPLAEVVGIARQLVEALDAAHERGIVHRDLKPANIKITPEGVVKVLDFGLATAVSGEGAAADLMQSPTITVGATGAGVLLGTAPYMSPEQARGVPVDKRADIWAFGCVLYEMLTGRAAFAGATLADTLAAIVERDPDWTALPAETPAGLAQLVRRCLEKNVKRRLRDIGDASSALHAQTVADAGREAVVPVGPRRSAQVAWSVAAIMAAAALSTVLWSRTGDRTQPALWSSSAGPQFNRITTDDSFSTEPAISRDGLVVYASDRAGNGQLDLWLQRTSGGQPSQLTFDLADDREPTFSPDGSLIAFRSDRDGGGIYVMEALVGEKTMPARRVAEGGRAPRFSPDGTRIAYWSGGNWLASPGGEARSVFIVTLIGGGRTPVARGFFTAHTPIWSPNGRSLLFFGRKSKEASLDWWWAPLDDRAPMATGAYKLLSGRGFLDADTGGERNVLPSAWTSKGVLFSARHGESANLWRLGVSERDGRVSEASLERLTNGTGANLLPASDGASRIVFQAADEAVVSLTLQLEPNTRKVQGDVVRRTYDAGAGEARNSLDRDGRYLAYARVRKGGRQFWVMDLEKGQERHVMSAPDGHPNISPDGTKLAYSLSENGVRVGYTARVSNGAVTKVCERCSLQGWLQDSQHILALFPGDSRVFVIDTGDGTTRDLVVSPPRDDAEDAGRDRSLEIGRLNMSWDNRWLAIDTPLQVWVAPVHPDRPSPKSEWVSVLTKLPGSAERPAGWSPDGRWLYLLLERDGFRDLWAQGMDPAHGTPIGKPDVVHHLHDPRYRWGSTPLGSAIVNNAFVFNQVEQTGTIWLLEPGK